MEKRTNGQLKKACDIQVRKYFLQHAERNGRGEIFCPLKERWYTESKMQIAHHFDRGILNTRYEKNNLHLISEQSNVWDAKELAEGFKSLHHKEYETWLKKEIGIKNFEKLLEMSKELLIFTQQDYLDVLEQYKTE